MLDEQAAIETLLTSFGRCADRGDGDELARLFLAAGVLNVNSKIAEGHQAIARLTNERTADPTLKSRHVWANLLIEKSDASTICTSAIQMTYEQRDGSSGSVRVSDLADTFEKDAAGVWRFASRVVTRQITVAV